MEDIDYPTLSLENDYSRGMGTKGEPGAIDARARMGYRHPDSTMGQPSLHGDFGGFQTREIPFIEPGNLIYNTNSTINNTRNSTVRRSSMDPAPPMGPDSYGHIDNSHFSQPPPPDPISFQQPPRQQEQHFKHIASLNDASRESSSALSRQDSADLSIRQSPSYISPDPDLPIFPLKSKFQKGNSGNVLSSSLPFNMVSKKSNFNIAGGADSHLISRRGSTTATTLAPGGPRRITGSNGGVTASVSSKPIPGVTMPSSSSSSKPFPGRTFELNAQVGLSSDAAAAMAAAAAAVAATTADSKRSRRRNRRVSSSGDRQPRKQKRKQQRGGGGERLSERGGGEIGGMGEGGMRLRMSMRRVPEGEGRAEHPLFWRCERNGRRSSSSSSSSSGMGRGGWVGVGGGGGGDTPAPPPCNKVYSRRAWRVWGARGV